MRFECSRYDRAARSANTSGPAAELASSVARPSTVLSPSPCQAPTRVTSASDCHRATGTDSKYSLEPLLLRILSHQIHGERYTSAFTPFTHRSATDLLTPSSQQRRRDLVVPYANTHSSVSSIEHRSQSPWQTHRPAVPKRNPQSRRRVGGARRRRGVGLLGCTERG